MVDAEIHERQQLERAVELVVIAAGRLFRGWGFREMLGRTWAILFVSPDPLDAETLQARLDTSTGSMNTALRDLVEMGLIYRQTPVNKRRFVYYAERDLWLVTTRLFQKRERGRFESLLDLLKEAESILLELSKTDGAVSFQLDQVRRLVDVGAFVMGLLDVLMARTKKEIKTAQKWLMVSAKLGGDPIGRVRKVLADTLPINS